MTFVEFYKGLTEDERHTFDLYSNRVLYKDAVLEGYEVYEVDNWDNSESVGDFAPDELHSLAELTRDDYHLRLYPRYSYHFNHEKAEMLGDVHSALRRLISTRSSVSLNELLYSKGFMDRESRGTYNYKLKETP